MAYIGQLPVAGSQTQIQGSKYSRKTVASASQKPVARCLKYQTLILFELYPVRTIFSSDVILAEVVLGGYPSNDKILLFERSENYLFV